MQASALRTSIHDRPNRCKIVGATAAMSTPITSPGSFAKTAAITCTSSVTITAYRCTRRARFIRESDMPEHIIKGHLRGDT